MNRLIMSFATYSKEEGYKEYEAVTVKTKYTETVVAYVDKDGKPYPAVVPKEEGVG